MKFTTRLDHISHCQTTSGTNRSNIWTYTGDALAPEAAGAAQPDRTVSCQSFTMLAVASSQVLCF